MTTAEAHAIAVAVQERRDELVRALEAVLRVARGVPKWAEDDARRVLQDVTHV